MQTDDEVGKVAAAVPVLICILCVQLFLRLETLLSLIVCSWRICRVLFSDELVAETITLMHRWL